MYVSRHHQMPEQAAMLDLIDAHPLGAWVCHAASGLVANHIPFFLDRTRGTFGTLMGHVSRANPVWTLLQADTPSVILFQEAQHYITPNWYPGKAVHGRVVPTWNYSVAHAHGTARAIEDPQWLRTMLRQLTDAQEAGHPAPWRVADAPAEFIDQLMRGIVGIEIPIRQLEGKRKVSQDEDLPDRLGTVQGLQSQGGEAAQTMATLVRDAIAPLDLKNHA